MLTINIDNIVDSKDYNIKELTELLHISRSTVYNYEKKGLKPRYHKTGHVFFKGIDVKKFLRFL